MEIRIILADDHHVVRCGVKQLLEKEPDFKIVGEAENGQQVLDMLEKGLQADVLLTDFSMPIMNGIELARTVTANHGHVNMGLLTIQEEECYIQQAFQAGIKSYLFKTADPDELIYAVRQVAKGKSYLCSGLSHQLISRITQWAKKSTADNTADVDFSSRELDVLRLIADGFTNEEAADKLFTSRRTVEGHRQSMIDKTGCRNSLALVRYAVQRGIIN
jgi:DNA-binding NarL/FixJ family response regulator